MYLLIMELFSTLMCRTSRYCTAVKIISVYVLGVIAIG
jgi:hypothetical protein